MAQKREISILINPIAGIKDKQKVLYCLEKHLDHDVFVHELHYTSYAGHARELAREAAEKGKAAVIVAGGDGTVNEVASALLGSHTALGIIPVGSGNGFARQMNIPCNTISAVKCINGFRCRWIDTFTANDRFALNLAGVGFDGLVAEKFAQLQTRGFLSYIRAVVSLYPQYKSFGFSVKTENINLEEKSIMVCVANSGQFGNNAVIAPWAVAHDGLLDICILQRVPVWLSPVVAIGLLTGSIHRTSFVQYYRAAKVCVKTDKAIHWHIDGDPCGLTDQFTFQINPLSLQLLV